MTEPNAAARRAGAVETPKSATLEQMLCDVPLNSPQIVSLLFSQPEHGSVGCPTAISLHCDHQNCGGARRHEKHSSDNYRLGNTFYVFATYVCTNCRSNLQVFGLKAERSSVTECEGCCTKIYQEPAFGEPIPKRFFKVIGEENRKPFLQARRAIARGLGIGAYAYYRRIVENTKFALVDSVLEVARATNAPAEQIKLLEAGQSERQFSKSIEMLRDVDAIPAVLLIDGHNPLALLHDLLSEGIHELDDDECLKRAQEAEVILCEVANRMQIALTERKTVKDALSSILNRKAGKDAVAARKANLKGPDYSRTTD